MFGSKKEKSCIAVHPSFIHQTSDSLVSNTIFEPVPEKTNNLHRRKQSRRSAAQ